MSAEPVTVPATTRRGAMHRARVFDHALGELTHAQIAAKYGVSTQAEHQFSVANRDEINQAKQDLSAASVDVFGVQKREQLGLISDQIAEVVARIESGELTVTQEKGFRNLLAKLVRQMSELTGELRTQVDVSGDLPYMPQALVMGTDGHFHPVQE